jgi:hypothetical protein
MQPPVADSPKYATVVPVWATGAGSPRRLRLGHMVRAAEDLLSVSLSDSVAMPMDPAEKGLAQDGAHAVTAEIVAAQRQLATVAAAAWADRVRGPRVADLRLADGPGPDCLLEVPGAEAPFRLLFGEGTLARTVEVPRPGSFTLTVEGMHRGAAMGHGGVDLVVEVDGVERWAPAVAGNHDVVVLETTLALDAGPHEIRLTSRTHEPGLEIEDGPPLCVVAEATAVSRLWLDGPGGAVDCALEDADCARDTLADLASRAWRRPVSEGSLEVLSGVVDDARDRGESAVDAVAAALEVVLSSPRFALHLEPTQPGQTRSLDDWELASRLSFALWGTLPDAELRGCAVQGRLAHEGSCGLVAQAERLLTDGRAEVFVAELASRWLGLGELDGRDLPDGLTASDLASETHALLDGLFTSSSSRLVDLLTQTSTWRSAALAAHLDEGAAGPSTVGSERAGLLGHAAVLTASSLPTRTVPSRRGAWVWERLLCEPVGTPPEFIDNSRTEDLHAEFPGCRSCHERLDPVGEPLERFDELGRQRDVDIAPVALPEGGVASMPHDVRAWLMARPELEPCLVTSVASHVLDGPVTSSPEVAAAFLQGGDGWHDLLMSVIDSPVFRSRTAAEAP